MRRGVLYRLVRALLTAWLAVHSLLHPGLAAGKLRVGLVDATSDEGVGRALIEELRSIIEKSGLYEILPRGPARSALEEVLDPAQVPEAIARTRAQALLEQAREAYAGFEYDLALDRLRQAEAILRTAEPSVESVGLLADVNQAMGLIYAGRGDKRRAVESFRLVNRLTPDRAALDPGTYRPQVVTLYANAVKQNADTAAASAGSARISTEPSPATIWINGQVVGTSPLDIPTLEGGDHYITATLEGHSARTERIRIDPSRALDLPLLLPRVSPVERAQSIRRRLMGSKVPPEELARVADALANLASADILVLLDQDANGTPRAIVYDASEGKLGPWLMAKSGTALVPSLPQAAKQAPVAVPEAGKVARDLKLDLQPNRPHSVPARPWYRTGWGRAALIGGGLLIGAGIVALTADRDRRFVLGWCFDDACP
ncbi:MAG: PEGA domain-containing protein [Deltaproteobacteria bacterium]|nr:PEGA domain-containing protein [Deltaproteobacteria bacterium]